MDKVLSNLLHTISIYKENINHPLYIIYTELNNNLNGILCLDNYLDNNNHVRELVNLLVQYVKYNKNYSSCTSNLSKQLIGYELIEKKLEHIMHNRYVGQFYSLHNTDVYIKNNLDILYELDRFYVVAGFLAKYYI